LVYSELGEHKQKGVFEMGKVHIGLNTEFSRSSDKPFEWAVEKTAEMGYEYIEPMIHFGRELMSEAGYFHTVSMFDDPYRIKDACDKAGLNISGLQSHGPLGRPEVHGEYIKLAIRVAAEIGVPVINTDEGLKAKWTTEEEDFVLIKYTLQEAAFVAERRGVKIGLEPHAQYSKTPEGLDRIYNLVDSPAIGINLDTGNAYLAGQDVYAWLDRVAERNALCQRSAAILVVRLRLRRDLPFVRQVGAWPAARIGSGQSSGPVRDPVPVVRVLHRAGPDRRVRAGRCPSLARRPHHEPVLDDRAPGVPSRW